MTGEIHLSVEQQAFSVISWLAVLILLQISIYPSLKRTFGSFAFPAAFPASVLVFTLISWYCGLVRFPIHLSLVPFLALIGYHLYRRDYSLAELKSAWHWEALFLIAFFFMLDIRFANPTISYAEKFMDHGFLASVIRSPVVPPLDPWFAGGSLNVYYYLGYWMLGCLAIVSGVPSNIAFNLSLPTVFALSAVSLYAIGTLLLDRFRWLPLVTLVLPNPALVFQIITGKAVNPAYDASLSWLGTRTITNTINEFPLFSFVWGDVHAHVVSIFNQVFLLFLLLFLYKRWETLERQGKIIVMALIAISLGSMPLFNTWDVLLYAPLVLVTGFLILWRNRAFPNRTAWALLLAVPPVSILCYLPFYIQLKTHTGAIALVRTPSDPLEFLWVNGIFIAIFFVLLVPEDPEKALAPPGMPAICPCRVRGSSDCRYPARVFYRKIRPGTSRYHRCFRSCDPDRMRTHLHEGQHGGDIFQDEYGLQVLPPRVADAWYCSVRYGGAMVYYLNTDTSGSRLVILCADRCCGYHPVHPPLCGYCSCQ